MGDRRRHSSRRNGGGGRAQESSQEGLSEGMSTLSGMPPEGSRASTLGTEHRGVNFKIGDCAHLPTFVARRVAARDFPSMRGALKILPLRFTSPADEQEYTRHLIQAYDLRTVGARYVATGTIIVLWVCIGVGTATQVYPVGNVAFGYAGIHVVMVLMALLLLSVRWTLRSENWRGFVETALYLTSFLNVVLAQIYLLVLSAIMPTDHAVDEIRIQEFTLWQAPLTLGLFYWNCIVTNLFMQTRSRFSWWPQLGTLFGLLTFNIVQSIIVTKRLMENDIQIHHQDRFLILVAAFEALSCLMVFAISWCGRWNLELQERIEFWKLIKSQQQLAQLKAGTTAKRKRGSTAVEDLLDITIRAVNCVQEAEFATGNPLLVESTEMLRRVQRMLTSENLYAVKMTRSSSKEDAATAELENQFYEIYANRVVAADGEGSLSSAYSALRTRVHDMPEGGAGGAAGDAQSPAGRARAGSAGNINFRSIAPAPTASAEFRRNVGRQWNCNFLQFASESPDIMVEVGALLLEPRAAELGTSPLKIRNYVYRLQRLYRPNPYHNATHGATVAHLLFCLLRMLGIADRERFSPLDAVTAVTAALGHDAGHPGRNNQFYVNSFSMLALVWNDRAVLENFHCALVFRALESGSCNFLDEVPPDQFKLVRKRVLELILATDMSQHFESISKFKLRRQAPGFSYDEDAEDMWFTIRMCIKCADLGHALVDWPQHQSWSLRVVEEFYQQGDEEAALGLPKSPLCDRGNHAELAKSQRGFIDFVVQPLFAQIEELDRSDQVAETCVKHLTYNKYKWEEMAKENETIPIPDHVLALRTDSASPRLPTLHIIVPRGFQLAFKENNRRGVERDQSTADLAPPNDYSGVYDYGEGAGEAGGGGGSDSAAGMDGASGASGASEEFVPRQRRGSKGKKSRRKAAEEAAAAAAAAAAEPAATDAVGDDAAGDDAAGVEYQYVYYDENGNEVPAPPADEQAEIPAVNFAQTPDDQLAVEYHYYYEDGTPANPPEEGQEYVYEYQWDPNQKLSSEVVDE